MPEKDLNDFFNGKSKYREQYISSTKANKVRKVSNNKFTNLFRKNFSFDYEVDLDNETSVLHRRNVVIRHIATLVNVVFLIFSFVGIKESNIVLNIAFWLLMTGLSITTSTLLKKGDVSDISRQKLIMYLECFYLLGMSVFLYIKIWAGFRLDEDLDNMGVTEYAILDAAYLLIYVSVIIMAFYQRPSLLKVMYLWIFILVTIINIAFLHSDLFKNATSMKEFLEYMFITNKNIAIDILLRTIVLALFFVALYLSVSITSYIEGERIKERSQRMKVESNFVDVVNSVFTAVKVYNSSTEDVIKEALSAKRIAGVTKVLSKAMNYSDSDIETIVSFAKVHIDMMHILSIEDDKISENDFSDITMKTEVASNIMRRLQLSKKAEDIVSTVYENRVTPQFVSNINRTQNDLVSKIVLIASVYDILREERPYHTALNHTRSVEIITKSFTEFFPSDLIQRFYKYHQEILEAYTKAS